MEAAASEVEGGEEAFEFVEPPVFEVDYKGNCAYEVKVSVPAANATSQAAKMYDELQGEAELPGFRPGRAPRKLIERKFAKAVGKEVEAKLVSEAFQKLVKDQELRPLSVPDIDGLDDKADRSDEAPLTFTFKFEVMPRVELGTYRGIEVERPVVTIDTADVDQRIEETRQRMATYQEVEGAKAEENDQVVIDLRGTLDGEPFAGGTADDYPYVLGSKRFFDEFEDALKGAAAGEEKTCDVTFPADYFNESLREKTVQFVVKVKQVSRLTVPPLDDEFATRAGFESLEDMRTKMADELRESSLSTSNSMAEQRAVETVVANSTFEIPDSLVERIAEGIYRDEVSRLAQMRVPASEVRAREDELRQHARERALDNIKQITVLNEIGEAEGIEIQEADFEQEAETMATRLGLEAETVANYMRVSEERGTFEDRIFRNKALRVIMDNAKITDVELPHDEQDGNADEAGNA